MCIRDRDNTPTKSGVGATGDWDINVTGSANSAVHDGAGNDISSSYITGISVGNTSITYTKGDGTEQEETIKTDETLSIEGMAADAKATGDRINAIKIETDKTLTISGAAADAAATGVRIKLLEMVHGADVNGISFVTAFDTLDGVELTGVWNKKASRVDF